MATTANGPTESAQCAISRVAVLRRLHNSEISAWRWDGVQESHFCHLARVHHRRHRCRQVSGLQCDRLLHGAWPAPGLRPCNVRKSPHSEPWRSTGFIARLRLRRPGQPRWIPFVQVEKRGRIAPIAVARPCLSPGARSGLRRPCRTTDPTMKGLPAAGEPLGSQAPPDGRGYKDGGESDRAGDQLLLPVIASKFPGFAHGPLGASLGVRPRLAPGHRSKHPAAALAMMESAARPDEHRHVC